ncbi:SspB family protein [Gymnodinialimonas hymeniacidonis]|uniref:SspB family protein n=1 Tax=Gymnodinialimonas hymeniacidonis TaxID=3126508 RepID=UPI0034C67BA6
MPDSPSSIPYGRLMHEAVCGVIREVLRGVADNGLPGEHHFFITFNTRHDMVELADWLRDRYPEEMMIVIQNWYDDLVVEEEFFAVTLNFGDAPERLKVPFDAILTFVDPSVEFGWRFERNEEDTEDPAPENADTDEEADAAPDEQEEAPRDAEVVSLDTFRRNT